ncbi:MAG: hypothetical protein ACRCWM_10245 [Sarcina sp.]
MKRKLVLGCMVVAILGSVNLISCGGEEKKEAVKDKPSTETVAEKSDETDKKGEKDETGKTDKVNEGKKEEEKKENPAGEFDKSAQDKIVKEVQDILDSYGYKKIDTSEFITTNEDYIPELQNKDLCHVTEEGEESPAEFYYDYKEKKLYHINQGFWFIVTEDYKNITPDIAGMKEMGDEARETIKREKKN